MTDSEAEEWQTFRELLDTEYDWPASYPFKFIVPVAHLKMMESILSGSELRLRASKKGNYVSVSAKFVADSAEGIIDVYKDAAQIPGVISL